VHFRRDQRRQSGLGLAALCTCLRGSGHGRRLRRLVRGRGPVPASIRDPHPAYRNRAEQQGSHRSGVGPLHHQQLPQPTSGARAALPGRRGRLDHALGQRSRQCKAASAVCRDAASPDPQVACAAGAGRISRRCRPPRHRIRSGRAAGLEALGGAVGWRRRPRSSARSTLANARSGATRPRYTASCRSTRRAGYPNGWTT